MNWLPKLLILLSVGCLIGAQPSTSDSLYRRALQLHLSRIYSDTVLVLSDGDIELPTKIGRHRIFYFEDITQLAKGRKEGSVVILVPIELDKGDVIVPLADFGFQRPDRLLLSGREEFRYRYDPKCNFYNLVERRPNYH